MTSMMEQGKFPSKGGFILGIDIGTSTIKATLFHIESKKAWLPIVKPVKVRSAKNLTYMIFYVEFSNFEIR